MPTRSTSASPLSLPSPIARALMRRLMISVFAFYGGFEVTGVENVPQTGAVIFCPNHTSDSDPGALFCALPRADVYFMGKQELFANPLLGGLFRYYGGFPVVRDTADRKALRTALSVLKSGHGLVVFPEGRISRAGTLMHLQSGAALLAARSGAPIVPVAITGTREILPYGHRIPTRSRRPARVAFGPAIDLRQLGSDGNPPAYTEIMERLRSDLVALGASAGNEQVVPA